MDRQDWLAQEFERERAHLRGVAYRMLGSVSEAEDAVQEAWVRLDRRDPGGTDNLRGWLFTVAAHAARDRQRRRARWVPWLPAYEAQVPPPALPDEDGRLKGARDALGRLPGRDRLLLALRAQGLSYRDIAQAARIRPASVGRLLARAVDRWEAALHDGKDGESYDLLERQSHPGAR